MSAAVLYIVKSWIPKEYAGEFNAWYHGTHIPQMVEATGCLTARRFRAVETDDKFMYMAVYEFSDMDAFLKYENSEAKKDLVADFRKNYGGKAETKKYVWEQMYP
jgi:heme-degrading monooxygenase HmoA